MIKTKLVAALLVSGLVLTGCNRGAANNIAAKAPAANASAAKSAAPAAPFAPAGGEAMSPADFRTAFIAQCDQQIRAAGPVAPGVDVVALCGCAYDGAIGNRPNAYAYTQTPEAQPAFMQALAQCSDRAGAAASAPPPAAPEEAEQGAAEPDGE